MLQVEKRRCTCYHPAFSSKLNLRLLFFSPNFFQLATTTFCCVTIFEAGGTTCNNAFQVAPQQCCLFVILQLSEVGYMLYLQQSGKTKTLNWHLLCCVATCSNLVLVFLQLSRRWAIYCTSSKSEQSKKFNSRHSSLDSASMLIYIHAHSVDGNMDEYRWEYSHHFWSSIKKKAICMNTVWFY